MALRFQSAIRKSPFVKGDLEGFPRLNAPRRTRRRNSRKVNTTRLELSAINHGSGHGRVRRLICGITSAPKRAMVSKVYFGSIPGQSTMNHITSVWNSS
jgi:hypothetical protein